MNATSNLVQQTSTDHLLVDNQQAKGSYLFQSNRPDWQAILQSLEGNERILDCGCADGFLLAEILKKHPNVTAYGIENQPQKILAALKKNLSVIQHNLEKGLDLFADQSFDIVILSQTLQTIHATEFLLKELIRVGKKVIISFPNFGYWPHRLSVLKGRMPVSKILPFEWYNTPNVRVLTIKDFEALAPSLGIQILNSLALTPRQKKISWGKNWRAELAVYLIKALG
jgi:methionine biosynthesis protein MetW